MILSDVDVTELRDPSALYTDTIDVIDPPELLRKDFVTAMDSDSRKTKVRVAFVMRRTSPQVKAPD